MLNCWMLNHQTCSHSKINCKSKNATATKILLLMFASCFYCNCNTNKFVSCDSSGLQKISISFEFLLVIFSVSYKQQSTILMHLKQNTILSAIKCISIEMLKLLCCISKDRNTRIICNKLRQNSIDCNWFNNVKVAKLWMLNAFVSCIKQKWN